MKFEEQPLVHIHAQAFWHDSAFIVANTEGLCKLVNTIIEAIASLSGEGTAELICHDGEGYTLKIIRKDNEQTWDKLALPYTDPDAKESNPEAVHPSKLIDITLKSTDLEQFSGSETYYNHPSGLIYTEGVQHLAEHGRAYWLIDAIASHQPQCMKDPMLKSFQHWILKVNPDHTAQLICERDTNDIAFTQNIDSTDFPLDTVKLYLVERVLMLTSEY